MYIRNCINNGYLLKPKTVNGGNLRVIDGIEVEILSHKFHNPEYNIVCVYYMEDGKKIELTYYKNIKNDKDGYGVYMFKDRESLDIYYSRNYTVKELPLKYRALGNRLKDLHSKIDFDKYDKRERG